MINDMGWIVTIILHGKKLWIVTGYNNVVGALLFLVVNNIVEPELVAITMPNNIVDDVELCCPNNIVASCLQQLLIFGCVRSESYKYGTIIWC